MKSIFIKLGKLKNGEDCKTQDLIKIALDTMPPGGFKYKDYKERARVENAMDDIKPADEGNSYPYFQLEEHDFENLKKWIDLTGYGVRDQFVLDFLQQFHI